MGLIVNSFLSRKRGRGKEESRASLFNDFYLFNSKNTLLTLTFILNSKNT